MGMMLKKNNWEHRGTPNVRPFYPYYRLKRHTIVFSKCDTFPYIRGRMAWRLGYPRPKQSLWKNLLFFHHLFPATFWAWKHLPWWYNKIFIFCYCYWYCYCYCYWNNNKNKKNRGSPKGENDGLKKLVIRHGGQKFGSVYPTTLRPSITFWLAGYIFATLPPKQPLRIFKC